MLGVPSDPLPNDPDWAGQAVFTDVRTAETTASQEALWRVIQGIGGERGWYSNPLLWAIRGWVDKLVGGVGLRRGRRHRDRLLIGDAVDFWRVEAIEPGSLLRLRAEMLVPGKAWLELRATPDGDGSRYDQRAVFFPPWSGRAAVLARRPAVPRIHLRREWRTASRRRPKQRMPRKRSRRQAEVRRAGAPQYPASTVDVSASDAANCARPSRKGRGPACARAASAGARP